MRRNLYLVVMIFLFLGFVTAQFLDNIQVVEADLVESPSDFEELATMTPIVINGEMIGISEIIEFDDVKFVQSEILVLEIYRDVNERIEVGNKIVLSQTEELEKIPNTGDEMVLFLKNNSEENLNLYRCVGLYNGKFEMKKDMIKNNNFKSSKSSKVELSKKDLNLILDSNPYNEKLYSKKTKEELIQEDKEHEEKIKNDLNYQEFIEKNN